MIPAIRENGNPATSLFAHSQKYLETGPEPGET
jgi:hypothetical protein